MDQNKQNLQMAIADFESGVYKSTQKAILAYSVSLSILSDQLNSELLKHRLANKQTSQTKAFRFVCLPILERSFN